MRVVESDKNLIWFKIDVRNGVRFLSHDGILSDIERVIYYIEREPFIHSL